MLGSTPLASVSIAAGKFLISIPTAPVAVTETVGRPASDVSMGNWLPSAGPSLYGMINEVVADAATYIHTESLGTCEIALNATVSPGTSLSYRASSSMGNGLTVRLLVDGVAIATWAHGLTTTDDLYTRALSPAQTAKMATGVVTVQLTST